MDTKADTLMPIIRYKIKPDSIVYTDCYRSYNALDVGEFKHYRINHSKLFAQKHNHINGIENFWNQTKRHFRKDNGIPRKNFNLFLKECAWRFNIGSPKLLLKDLNISLKNFIRCQLQIFIGICFILYDAFFLFFKCPNLLKIKCKLIKW